MKKSNALLNAQLLSLAAVLAGGYLAGDASAQQQIRRSPSAPATAAPVPPAPAPPPANVIARPVAPAPASPPPLPPAIGGKPGASSKMASVPGGQNHGAMPNRNFVPVPTGMTNTLDSKVCSQHAGISGGLGCTAGLPNGMLALVWNAPNPKVDGYRLFRVDGTLHQAVAIPANGSDFTAALLNPPQGGFGNRCYAVVAFRGTNESELSAPYCTGTGSVMAMTTDTFTPDQVRSSLAGKTSSFSSSSPPLFSSANNLQVGGVHGAYKHTTGDVWSNLISRGGLHFDLGKLSQKHIFSAKLHITVDKTALTAGAVDHGTSCASAIDLGKDRWWTYSDWIPTARQHSTFDTAARLQPGSVDGPDATYDVTPIVVDWAAEASEKNFGFILMSDDQGIDAFTQNGCQTTYTSTITLEVKYWG